MDNHGAHSQSKGALADYRAAPHVCWQRTSRNTWIAAHGATFRAAPIRAELPQHHTAIDSPFIGRESPFRAEEVEDATTPSYFSLAALLAFLQTGCAPRYRSKTASQSLGLCTVAMRAPSAVVVRFPLLDRENSMLVPLRMQPLRVAPAASSKTETVSCVWGCPQPHLEPGSCSKQCRTLKPERGDSSHLRVKTESLCNQRFHKHHCIH
jgi:hypothetical protein